MNIKPLVQQKTITPTRKVGSGLVALAVAKGGFAIGAFYGIGWMEIPEVTNMLEVAIPAIVMYVVKDRANA